MAHNEEKRIFNAARQTIKKSRLQANIFKVNFLLYSTNFLSNNLGFGHQPTNSDMFNNSISGKQLDIKHRNLLPSLVLVIPLGGDAVNRINFKVEHTLQLSLLVLLIECDRVFVIN